MRITKLQLKNHAALLSLASICGQDAISKRSVAHSRPIDWMQ